jgi:hypothetical protein
MIIPSSKFAENINQFLDDLSSGEKTEFAILHNERIEVIVISTQEYERMYRAKIAYDNWRNDRRQKIRAACEDPEIQQYYANLIHPKWRMREYITSMGTT